MMPSANIAIMLIVFMLLVLVFVFVVGVVGKRVSSGMGILIEWFVLHGDQLSWPLIPWACWNILLFGKFPRNAITTSDY
jgi:hypothetical protein